jgi:hypothetical protein
MVWLTAHIDAETASEVSETIKNKQMWCFVEGEAISYHFIQRDSEREFYHGKARGMDGW